MFICLLFSTEWADMRKCACKAHGNFPHKFGNFESKHRVTGKIHVLEERKNYWKLGTLAKI
jgi:hypothetical protein